MKFKILTFAPLLASVLAFGMAFAQTQVAPAEVQNITATPDAGKISLAWDEATDEDGVVTGYKIYYGTQSVQTEDDSYADEILVPAQTSYDVENLQNGVEYFFALTAVDDEGNESETYSVEVSAIPVEGSPTVISAEQTSNSRVVVTMSKPVKLQGGKNSFALEEKDSGREITVQEASVEGEKVSLTISEEALDTGKIYQVIASSLVEDEEGNPVRSGITDTAEFTAKFFDPPKPEPIPEPVIEEPKTETPPAPEQPSAPKEIEDANPASSDYWAPEEEKPVAPKDTNPPLDASRLKVDSSNLKSNQTVILSWNTALDIENDIADQILYSRKGLGQWDDGISLGKYTSDIELDVELEENYQIKIETVDQSGNKSDGATISFSTDLAKSGPGGSVVVLLIAAFLGLFLISASRRTA